MALSKEQIAKLQNIASTQQPNYTPEQEPKTKRKWHPFRIIMIIALCAAIITIVLVLLFNFSMLPSFTNLNNNSNEENITANLTDDVIASEISSSENETISSNIATEEFIVSLPQSITGFTSEEEAKQTAISYGFEFEEFTEQGTSSYLITPEQQEQILGTLYTQILTTLNGLKTANTIYDFNLADDLMSTRIITSNDNTDYTSIAEEIANDMVLYGYFLGYQYMEPTISFYNQTGEFENFITVTI